MEPEERKLLDEIIRRGGLMICAYNSDIFALLACILAYYEVRGSTAEEMIVGNAHMRQMINAFKEDALSGKE